MRIRFSRLLAVAMLLTAFTPVVTANSLYDNSGDRFFDSGFESFYAGPQWFVDALSNPAATWLPRWSSFEYDASGDRFEAAYVGNQANPFDVNLFNNISSFGHGTVFVKTSSPTILNSAAPDQYYKTNGTNSAWTSSVWGSSAAGPFTSAWVSGNDAFFTATSTITGATTTVSDITASANVTVTAGGTLTLSNTLITVDDTFTFSLGTQVLDTSSAITKDGLGALTISTASAYTGGFTLNAGVVNIGSTNALGTGTLTINGGILQSNAGTARAPAVTQINIGGNFTIGSANTGLLTFAAPVDLGGATRQITDDNTSGSTVFSGVISNGGLTKLGNGELDLTGAASNTYTGLTTVSAGTLGLGKTTAGLNAFGGDLTINGGAVVYSSSANNQIPDSAKVTISSGSIDFGSRTETIGQTATAASGFLMSGGAITKAGTGTVTFANGATMTAGTMTHTGTSGAYSFTTEFNFSGGTIDFTSASGTSAATVDLRAGTGTGITYSSSGTSTAQITNTGGGSASLSLNTAAGATTVFTIADAPSVATEMIIAVPITGVGKNLQKAGGGVLALTGANTYTGTTTISGGTLQLGNGGTTGSLSTSSTISNNGNFTINRSNTVTQGTTFSGSAITGTGSLTQSGTGTTTLNVLNPYSGATIINGGTLELKNTGGVALSGTSGVQINNGGTLLFSANNQLNQAVAPPITLGTVDGSGAAPTINAGGTSQGGPNAGGTVGLGALTLNVNSTISLTGTSVLHFANSTAQIWQPGTILSITNWNGTPTTGGGLEQLLFGTGNVPGLTVGQLGQIQFIDPTGFAPGTYSALFATLDLNEIVPGAPIPEPSTWIGGALALGAIGFTQRRRLRCLIARRA